MAIVIDVLVIIRTLPKANIIDDQFQVALDCSSDCLKGLEFSVGVLINDDLLHTHGFVLKGLSHGIDTGSGGGFHFKARETFPDQIDEIGHANDDRVCTRLIDPFEKPNELSITLSRILEISKTGGVEQITKLQPIFVTDLNISYHIISIDLRQNKTGSCSSHHIEREFAEEGIHGCPFEVFDKREIPIGSHPEFHN
jgi:hypothetical protein